MQEYVQAGAPCSPPGAPRACSLALVSYGRQPNELALKRLAMLGSTALVLAHSIRDHEVARSSYAGTRRLLALEQSSLPAGPWSTSMCNRLPCL